MTVGVSYATRERLLLGLQQTLQQRRLYPDGHPAIARTDEAFTAIVAEAMRDVDSVRFVLGAEPIVIKTPLPHLRASCADLLGVCAQRHVACLVLRRGLAPSEVASLWSILLGEDDVPRGLESTTYLNQRGITHAAFFLVNPALSTGATSSILPRDLARLTDDAVGYLTEALVPLTAGAHLGVEALDLAAVRVVDGVIEGVWSLPPHGDVTGFEATLWHSVDVGVVCAVVGLALGVPRAALLRLASVGLLHDVGKLLLPAELSAIDQLADVPDPLREQWQSHGRLGASILSQEPSWDSAWALGALHHHDRLGAGLSATPGIVDVLALADYYATRSAEWRALDDAHELFAAHMVATGSEIFDRRLVRVLLQAIGVYPPGTVVRLSTGQRALVLRPNPSLVTRPIVRLLGDDRSTGAPSSPLVDLSAPGDPPFAYDASVVGTEPD